MKKTPIPPIKRAPTHLGLISEPRPGPIRRQYSFWFDKAMAISVAPQAVKMATVAGVGGRTKSMTRLSGQELRREFYSGFGLSGSSCFSCLEISMVLERPLISSLTSDTIPSNIACPSS